MHSWWNSPTAINPFLLYAIGEVRQNNLDLKVHTHLVGGILSESYLHNFLNASLMLVSDSPQGGSRTLDPKDRI